MSEEANAAEIAALKSQIKNLEDQTETHKHTLYGEDNASGLVREFRDHKNEAKYLRTVYILGTALVLPWINALLGKLGLGPIKLG